MGGFGSGGHNKKHEQVEEKTSVRVDSFAVYNFLQYDKYIHYKEKVDRNGDSGEPCILSAGGFKGKEY